MSFVMIIATCFAPVLMLPFNIALYVFQKKRGMLYAFLIAVGLAAIAFNFNPFDHQNTDILRHWQRLETVGEVSFAEATQNDAYSTLMGYYFLLKIFSVVSNHHILPAVVTLLGYFFCLFVFQRLDLEGNKTTRFLAVFLFLGCISFLGFCSGIRQYLAFSIFSMVFCAEAVFQRFKKVAWIAYLALVTLHTSIIIVIVLRLITELLCRAKKGGWIALLVVLWSAIQKTVIDFLAKNFGQNLYVSKFVEMFDFYSEHGSKTILPVFLWRLALMLFCVFVVLFLLKKSDVLTHNRKRYLLFCLILCAFTFGAIASYDVFGRFSAFSFLLILPLLPSFFKRLKYKTGMFCLGGLLAFGGLVTIYNFTQYATFNWNPVSDVLFTNVFDFMKAIFGI